MNKFVRLSTWVSASTVYSWYNMVQYDTFLHITWRIQGDSHWGWETHICITKLRPSLVQIMACHLFSVKPLSEPILDYCELDPREHISVKLESKSAIFIKENAFENVGRKVSAILSQLQCVMLIFTGDINYFISTLRQHYISRNLLIIISQDIHNISASHSHDSTIIGHPWGPSSVVVWTAQKFTVTETAILSLWQNSRLSGIMNATLQSSDVSTAATIATTHPPTPLGWFCKYITVCQYCAKHSQQPWPVGLE